MARLIFSKIKKTYNDYTKYEDWLKANSYPDFCGYSWITHQQSLTIDHYKPQEHFPKLKGDPDNLILCTHTCNASKNDYHPEVKKRRTYKECTHKIFNYRREDIGKTVKITNEGLLDASSSRYKERVNFNEQVFKFNRPSYQDIRLEYMAFLRNVIRLHKRYKKIPSSELKQDLDEAIEYCSKRYIFYKLFNVKIPKQIEKLLTNQTQATFV